jgi:hypothetical protein
MLSIYNLIIAMEYTTCKNFASVTFFIVICFNVTVLSLVFTS